MWEQILESLNITAAVAELPTLTVGEFTGRIIQIALGLLGIMAFLIILYGGFLWMTSGGNEETIRKAKATLSAAAIGLAVILVSFGVVAFIMNQIYRQQILST